MYGDKDGTIFDEVHNNINSSQIKIDTESWYKTNIADKGYNSYVSNDVGFCGDRTLYSGDGVSTTQYSYFGAYQRFQKKSPQFTCPNIERDLYTSTDSSVGNKALTYPIGLITYDELVFAGLNRSYVNKLSYAYSNQSYWTMSPSYFDASGRWADAWHTLGEGRLNIGFGITGKLGLRPVINLKSDVKITGGIGTSNDPFIVDTNN